MALDADECIPIPLPLSIVIWLEILIFVPFTIKHYFGPFNADWRRLSATKLGQQTLWAGEMLNGVGATVLMYMLVDALVEGHIGRIEMEILFLSHSLWIGTMISFMPPWPIRKFVFLLNPHTYLALGVVATGYSLVRPVCFVSCAIVLGFTCYRRAVQLPRDVYRGAYTWAVFRDAMIEIHNEEPDGLKWEEAGCEKPAEGKPLSNEKLAAALQGKPLKKGMVELSRSEWAELGIKALSKGSFVKVGDKYFRAKAEHPLPQFVHDVDGALGKPPSAGAEDMV